MPNAFDSFELSLLRIHGLGATRRVLPTPIQTILAGNVPRALANIRLTFAMHTNHCLHPLSDCILAVVSVNPEAEPELVVHSDSSAPRQDPLSVSCGAHSGRLYTSSDCPTRRHVLSTTKRPVTRNARALATAIDRELNMAY
ncbi:hypothetical protein ACG7TL_007677 [Trametes sanguinea]